MMTAAETQTTSQSAPEPNPAGLGFPAVTPRGGCRYTYSVRVTPTFNNKEPFDDCANAYQSRGRLLPAHGSIPGDGSLKRALACCALAHGLAVGRRGVIRIWLRPSRRDVVNEGAKLRFGCRILHRNDIMTKFPGAVPRRGCGVATSQYFCQVPDLSTYCHPLVIWADAKSRWVK